MTFAGVLLLWCDILRKQKPPVKLDLSQQVNPNNAEVALLVCLPGLGPHRAQALADYRQEQQRRDPNTTVFTEPNDLIAVKGIGHVEARSCFRIVQAQEIYI